MTNTSLEALKTGCAPCILNPALLEPETLHPAVITSDPQVRLSLKRQRLKNHVDARLEMAGPYKACKEDISQCKMPRTSIGRNFEASGLGFQGVWFRVAEDTGLGLEVQASGTERKEPLHPKS